MFQVGSCQWAKVTDEPRNGGKELRTSTIVGKSSWWLLDCKRSVPFLVS